MPVSSLSFPDYPFTSHYTAVNGLQMHYLDEGQAGAEPIVMVHGNPSWSFFFRRPIHALRDEFRCIVPDHIGMGLSDKPSADNYGYTLDNRIDDLETLLEQLQIGDNITLAVHDWGGMIGMAYACRNAHRIKRLIIMNTAAFHLPVNISLPWQLLLARIPLLGPPLILGLNAFCRGAVTKGVVRRPMSGATSQAYLDPYNSWSNRLSILRFVQDIPLQPGDPAYDTVTKVDRDIGQFSNLPVLICWGMQDFVFDGRFLAEWTKRFPQAEVAQFENAGHYVLEDATDEIVLLMKQFLDKNPIEKSG